LLARFFFNLQTVAHRLLLSLRHPYARRKIDTNALPRERTHEQASWELGAERTQLQSHLLQIFADLEDSTEGAGERFVHKPDTTLQNVRAYPEIAPLFEQPVWRLVIGSTGYGLFYSVEARRIIVQALIHLNTDSETIRERQVQPPARE
jgi:hypothetical protein